MGDPRKARKSYSNPKKPWDKARLDVEKPLVSEYGIVNKKELHKMNALLRKFSQQAKVLMSATSEQSENERKSLLHKLQSLALIGTTAQLDDVLALQLKNILERRLQTVVLRKGLANTIKQARQFITHRHVKVAGKLITSPSYMVSKEEEANVAFVEKSTLANSEHPERPEQIFKAKESLKKAKHAPVKVDEAKAEELKAEVAEVAEE